MTETAIDDPIVDAEVVDESPQPEVRKLSMTSIGGLAVRKPQENLPFLNLMMYGDSGVGKTLLAGTAAFVEELSPVLFIDVEGGTLTLSQFDDTANIDVIRVTSWPVMQKLYDELYAGRHPYKTVVIDSLTEMQKLAMGSVLGYGKDLDPEGIIPEFKDWSLNTEQMRRLVRAFRDLSLNTIFTCLALDQEHPRKKNVFIKKPNLTKKLSEEIPAFFDVLFYLYATEVGGQNVRYIQTDKSDRIVAKCRVQGVPMFLEPHQINMEPLYDMLVRNVRPATELAKQQQPPTGGGGMKRSLSKK